MVSTVGVHQLHLAATHNLSQISDCGLAKMTFSQIKGKQSGKHVHKLLNVTVSGARMDHYIIKIGLTASQPRQNSDNQMLKGRWRV